MLNSNSFIKRKIIYNDKILYLILGVVCILWFSHFRNAIIMGDDLGIPFMFSHSTNIWDMIFGYSGGNKYRPVLNAVLLFEYKLFGLNYQCYFWFNVIVHLIISFVVYSIVKMITNDNKPLAFVGGILFVTSTFSYYNITQLLGIMEALCILLMLLAVKAAIQFYKTTQVKYLFFSLIFSTLLIFTHERYIVLVAVYIIFILFCNFLNFKSKIIYSLISTIPFIFNYAFKSLILGAMFFEGTGGQQIKLNFKQVLSFVFQSVMSILGINYGPNYLNGYNFLQYSQVEKMFSLASFGLIILTLLAFIFFNIIKEKNQRVKEIARFIIALALAGALIISYSVTIRVEMRWVFAPYVVFIIFFLYVINKLKFIAVIKYLTLAIICGVTLVNNFALRQNNGDIYFNRAFYISQSVYKNTIGEYGQSFSNYKVYFLYQNEMNWAIGGTDLLFLNQYLDKPLNGKMVNNLEEIDDFSENVKVFYLNNKLNIEELDTKYLSEKNELREKYNVIKNLDELFSSAKVLPETETSTPTGKGVCFLQDRSFTVVSNYSYQIPIDIKKDNELVFEINMPIDVGDGCTFDIYYDKEGKKTQLISKDIDTNQKSSIIKSKINQDLNSGKLVFSVHSNSADDAGDWVSFTNPMILKHK